MSKMGIRIPDEFLIKGVTTLALLTYPNLLSFLSTSNNLTESAHTIFCIVKSKGRIIEVFNFWKKVASSSVFTYFTRLGKNLHSDKEISLKKF